MTDFLCISVTFLQPTCHARLGQEEGAGNEWPPSPLRLFQALIAGAAARWSGQDDSTRAELKAPAPLAALRWLERLTASSPPTIFAPHATIGAAVPTYVPNNSADLVGKAWARGDSLATFDDRTRKVIRPTRLHGSTTLHYAWQLQPADRTGALTHIDAITGAARCIVALGWGVDAAIGDARVITSEQCAALGQGELKCWRPQRGAVRGVALRTPLAGTLDDLLKRHASFLSRLDGGILAPPVPLRQFGVVGYSPSVLSASRPFAAFAFKCASDPERIRSFRFEDAAKVAAMVRHAACRAAQSVSASPFPGDPEVFVAGHVGSEATSRQGPTPPRFSYLPVPSAIGPHPDGAFRRILIAEPFGGTGEQAAWAINALAGQPLIREETGDIVAVLEPLERWHSDKLVPAFIGRQDETGSRDWVSVTPVVLPGYDDRNRTKAVELLLRACDHAGFAGNVESAGFEPPPRHGASSGRMFLPRHLRGLPLHHVRLRFRDAVVGPVSLGAGRHCGLGVFIAE